MSYELAKALHIISVIAWMAGLMMLPRLYAYQTGSQPGGELEAKMIVASGALRRIILLPAMILTWLFGLDLVATHIIADWSRGPLAAFATIPIWLWVKLALVFAMSGWQGYLSAEGKRLAQGERRRSERFWRATNELPFLAAIVIVLLVVLKPF